MTVERENCAEPIPLTLKPACSWTFLVPRLTMRGRTEDATAAGMIQADSTAALMAASMVAGTTDSWLTELR